MSYIYRIENKKGLGCYQFFQCKNEIFNKLIAEKHDDDPIHHPMPLWDEGIDRKQKKIEISGFKNLKQLYKWFSSEDIDNLEYLGFKIQKIKVKKITAIGKCQVLAIK